MTTPAPTAPAYKARKGDLVAIQVRRISYSLGLGAGQGRQVTETWVVGEVQRATRDGWVTKVSWDRNQHHDPTDRWSLPHVHTEWVRVADRLDLLPRYARDTPVVQALPLQRDGVADRDSLIAATDGQRYPNPDAIRAAVAPFLAPGSDR